MPKRGAGQLEFREVLPAKIHPVERTLPLNIAGQTADETEVLQTLAGFRSAVVSSVGDKVEGKAEQQRK